MRRRDFSVKRGARGVDIQDWMKTLPPAERDLARAASKLEAAGDLAAAASAWVRFGDLVRAAELLEQDGQAALASELRALHQIDAGDECAAARHLEAAGDTAGAARLRAKAGEHGQVDRLLEAHGDPAGAAEAGGPDPDLAAGASALNADDLEGAEAALKRVQEGAPGYATACRLLGDLYQRQGRPAAAAVRYRRALAEARPRAGTAETWYRAGMASLEAGEAREALRLLTALWELDPSWRDVERKREHARLEVAGQAAGPDGAAVRYERGEELGRGGMGVVYRAQDLVLDREVAWKLLSPASDFLAGSRDLFLREARSAASLNHPAIVSIYDFGSVEGSLFIAMELVEGWTVDELVAAHDVVPVEMLHSLLVQAADALAYAHARGVVHCDLKPANLIWTPDGRLKITDFGLARFLQIGGGTGEIPTTPSASSTDRRRSQAVGTPHYMSPEQIRGERMGARTDQYALGVTLYELAAGELPFEGQNPFHATLSATPPPLTRADLPDGLKAIVLRCLEKDPADRFESAQALREAAEAYHLAPQ